MAQTIVIDPVTRIEGHAKITIQLDDGGYTILQRPDGLAFHIGDRVRVEGTQLELLAP